jgi:hypothetical protein
MWSVSTPGLDPMCEIEVLYKQFSPVMPRSSPATHAGAIHRELSAIPGFHSCPFAAVPVFTVHLI